MNYKINTEFVIITSLGVNIVESGDVADPKSSVKIEVALYGSSINLLDIAQDDMISLFAKFKNIGPDQYNIKIPMGQSALLNLVNTNSGIPLDIPKDEEAYEDIDAISQFKRRIAIYWNESHEFDLDACEIVWPEQPINGDNVSDQIILNLHVVKKCVEHAVREKYGVDSIEKDAEIALRNG